MSAGSRPTQVHPLAVQVMKEIGIDISDQRAKRMDQVDWSDLDTVVTLCAEGEIECPAVGPQVDRHSDNVYLHPRLPVTRTRLLYQSAATPD